MTNGLWITLLEAVRGLEPPVAAGLFGGLAALVILLGYGVITISAPGRRADETDGDSTAPPRRSLRLPPRDTDAHRALARGDVLSARATALSDLASAGDDPIALAAAYLTLCDVEAASGDWENALTHALEAERLLSQRDADGFERAAVALHVSQGGVPTVAAQARQARALSRIGAHHAEGCAQLERLRNELLRTGQHGMADDLDDWIAEAVVAR